MIKHPTIDTKCDLPDLRPTDLLHVLTKTGGRTLCPEFHIRDPPKKDEKGEYIKDMIQMTSCYEKDCQKEEELNNS